MKKAKHAALMLLVTGMLTPSLAQAEDVATDDKFKNGRPFQELAFEIESNTAAIESTEEEAALLQYELDALTLSVQTLQFAVSENSSRIALLESEIDAAQTQLGYILGAMGQVSNDLGALVDAAGDNSLAIADLESQLDDLATQAAAQLDLMAASLATMKADLQQEKSDLDGLAAYVEAVETGAQIAIGEMQANLDQLAIEMAAAETLVAQAQLNKASIDELEALVSANAELAASRQALEDLRSEYESHAHTFQDRSDTFETTTQQVWYTYTHTHSYTHRHFSHRSCSGFFRRRCTSYYYYETHYYSETHYAYRLETSLRAIAQYLESTTATVE